MKRQKHSMLLIAIALFICACDAIDELTEFDITEDFQTTVNVLLSENSEGAPVSLEESSIIDIGANQEIEDNLNLIQNVSIDVITFQVNNYIGAEGITISNAVLSFANNEVTLNDINLKQSDDDNTVYTINDTTTLNAIANYLEDNTTITITLSGTISSTPAQFDLNISLSTTVTIDVL